MKESPIPQPQQVQASISIVRETTKLVCIAGSQYIGSVTFDASSPQGISALAQMLAQYAAQMSAGIQVSNGAGIPGLRTP